MAGFVIVKLFGIVGALVTFGAYPFLKPELGTFGAVAVATVIGIFASIVIGVIVGA